MGTQTCHIGKGPWLNAIVKIAGLDAMRIGVLGAGSVGATLGKAWVKCGHDVMFGVRDTTAPKVQTLLAEAGESARSGTAAEAVADAEVIALALTWEAVPEVLQQIGNLDGKILLDCTNPLVGNQLDASLDLGMSGGEQVATWLPQARVVKIFNTIGWESMEDPQYGDVAATMFYAGDDDEAKQIAAQLASTIGFDPVDAGPLSAAKFLETLAGFWGQLVYGQALGRNIAWRLLTR